MGMGAGGCCGMGPCRGYGQGPVAPPGCGCCMGPGMGPGMGCGMGPSMGYSMRCGCQPWMMRDDWKDEQEQPPLKELDLSDDQVNKLIDLHAELQKKQIALHRKIDADQEKIGDLYDAEKLDETQLKKLVKEKAELQAELQINHRNSVDKALAVLTAEQKEKLGDCPIPFFGPQGDKFPGPGGKGLKGCQHRHRGR